MESSSGACDVFTILDWRESDRLLRCDVCDQAEASHPQSGRRRLSGSQIEEMRKRMIMATFEQQEEDRRRKESNGEPKAPATEI
ncbi:MAG: hypothetical protein ACRENA_15370 [Vulcanimicrobiaceae bacterium]